jgi:hypothetical protein
MKVKAAKSKGLALAGGSLSHDEFKKEIIKAEKGPFYSIERAKKLLNVWRKKKGSR